MHARWQLASDDIRSPQHVGSGCCATPKTGSQSGRHTIYGAAGSCTHETVETANAMPASTTPPATREPIRLFRLGVAAASAARGWDSAAAAAAATPATTASFLGAGAALQQAGRERATSAAALGELDCRACRLAGHAACQLSASCQLSAAAHLRPQNESSEPALLRVCRCRLLPSPLRQGPGRPSRGVRRSG